ncbi:hypothetical protein G7046_g6474 [Stylonectria norvegica]|nr:hypothetical protein G7046_g6474 [Stylonectria norvegica]
MEEAHAPNEGSNVRSACSECQRRKQKCNREWPCNHCQKRKVADQCRFKDARLPDTEKTVQENWRKRSLDSDDHTSSTGTGTDDDADSDGIDALGYMSSHALFGLTAQDETIKASSREFIRDLQSCPQLERALQIMPPRQYTDMLVQRFLNNVNFHYYILYPATFLEQYQKWWTDRAANKPLCIQWTCLLLTICACAAQYTDLELQRKLELELGQTLQTLTDQYHEGARELSSVVPIGHSHLTNVQYLFHSCYWFKSEARFIECWHVLNSAIREAQELGMHTESPDDHLPEFELEMRRRIWSVQISVLLGRPLIIDRADCNPKLPDLTLEGWPYSPLAYMKLQSGLIRQIFDRFGPTKNVVTPAQIQEYQDMVETWMETFPSYLDIRDRDTSLDHFPWVPLHRHYIRTMGYSMLLCPTKAYLARPFTIDATDAELKIRDDGLNYCLKLMDALHGFFNVVYPRDAKFHFVLFCIFDTSTVLCSAILHDEHHTLPRRDEVFKAIDEAHAMLERLNTVTKSAKTSYSVLSRIMQRLPRTVMMPRALENPAKRPRVTEISFSSQEVSPQHMLPHSASPQQVSPHGITPQGIPPQAITPPTMIPQMMASGALGDVAVLAAEPLPFEAYAVPVPLVYDGWLQEVPVGEDAFHDVGFANFTDEELGEFADLWNHQPLDLGFNAAGAPM